MFNGAGVETIRTATIEVLVVKTAEQENIPALVLPTLVEEETEPVTQSIQSSTPQTFGNSNNPFTGNSIQTSFSANSTTTPTQSTTTSNVLWGGAAAAMLGATLAEWQRQREEEAARLAALRNSGGGDEGGDGGGRTNAGRKAYQAMMQEKQEEKKPWWEQIAQTWNETIATPLLNIWNTTSKQITNAWNFVTTPFVNAWDTVTRVVKDIAVDVFRFFYNARGEDLVKVSEDEILRSPEIALWKTYIAAAINVQRDGLNLARDGYTSGKGPAQLSQQQLDTPYGKPYYSDDCEGEIKAKCIAGYGVGVDGSPYNPNVAVDGMTNRIEQVLKFAENQSTKRDINVTLDETDRFIITALSQNGPGFDKDDISNLLANYVSDGTIDWGGYFGDEYEDWTEKPWLKRGYLEAWQWIKTGKGGKDFDTEFSLELYYQEMRALESQGYPFPEGLTFKGSKT